MSCEAARELFRQRFGGEPEVIASAPARVNLIGEHTDYNGGEVLPIAIERRTVVAMARSTREQSRVASTAESEEGTFRLDAPEHGRKWWDYVAGTAVQSRADGERLRAIDVAVSSDVPMGAGLSSSAALEVAVAAALDRLRGVSTAPHEIALAAHRAENQFVGVASGIMDQFASALGRARHALHIWCDTMEVEHVPMREAVLIFDTAVPRSLRSSAFNTRRSECHAALLLLRQLHPELSHLAAATPEQIEAARLPEPLASRARHVSTETRRVDSAVAALRAERPLSGELLLDSHRSLREDYRCSSPELDWFVERAMREEGVRGARLTGAGWGGCAIALGDAAALDAVAPSIASDYERAFGRTPRTWLTHADDGMRIEEG